MCVAPLAIGFLMVVGILSLAWQVQRRGAFKALALDLGGAASLGRFHATHQGVAYRCRFISASRYSPARLIVALDAPPGPEFRVSRRTFGVRMLAAIGIGAEVPTGDPSFDAEAVVLCDALDFGRALFGDPTHRRAVADLLADGFTEVRRDQHEVAAEWSRVSTSQGFRADLVRATVERLRDLRDALPTLPAAPDATPNVATALGRGVLAAVSGGTFGVGLVLFGWTALHRFTPLDWHEVLVASLWVSVPWLLVFLGLAARTYHRTVTRTRVLGQIAVIAAIGFPLLGYNAEVALNCALDTGHPVPHSATVVDRATSHRRDGTTYWAVLASWRGDRQEQVAVSATEYARLVPQRSRMTVVTRPGWLGFEWVVDRRLDR